MAFPKAPRHGRRRFLTALLGIAVLVPLARFARPPCSRTQEFVRRDGWILRKDDLS